MPKKRRGYRPHTEEAKQKIREKHLARWAKIKRKKAAIEAEMKRKEEYKPIDSNKDIRQQLANWLRI